MNIPLKILLCFVIIKGFEQVNCANILYYMGLSSYSERILIAPYLEKLASAKGHSVTLFSPHPPKEKNASISFKDYSPKILQDFVASGIGSMSVIELRKAGVSKEPLWGKCVDGGTYYCLTWLNDPEIVKWVKESSFDLIIVDGFSSECGFGLVDLFKVPHIVFESAPAMQLWSLDAYGIPPEHSSIPDMYAGLGLEMSLYQKTAYILRTIYWHYSRRWINYPLMENGFQNAFQLKNTPSFDTIERSASLVLLDQHYTMDYPKSFPPTVIPIGGIRTIGSKVNSLPKHLESFIGGCSGFVYISLGSFAQSNKAHDYLKQAFLGAAKMMPSTCFLIKWDEDSSEAIPSNVLIQNWMPQKDILAHPKIKVAALHGGIGGIEEAIFFAVPLVVLPIFGDQDYNAHKVVQEGYGIKLEIVDLKAKELKEAIFEVSTNPKYKKNVERLSELFRDRPQHPLDTAVWWTEFVLRHGRVRNMIPHAVNQTWYETRLLDAWTLLSVLMLTTLFLLYILIKFVYALVKRFSSPKMNSKSDNVKKNK